MLHFDFLTNTDMTLNNVYYFMFQHWIWHMRTKFYYLTKCLYYDITWHFTKLICQKKISNNYSLHQFLFIYHNEMEKLKLKLNNLLRICLIKTSHNSSYYLYKGGHFLTIIGYAKLWPYIPSSRFQVSKMVFGDLLKNIMIGLALIG